MISILGCVKWLIARCLRVFSYHRVPNSGTGFQMQQFGQVQQNTDRDLESGLQVELRKNSKDVVPLQGYHEDSFDPNTEPKVEFEYENKADFQDFDQQGHVESSEQQITKQYMETTPIVDLDDAAHLSSIGDQGIKSILHVINNLDGFECLENNVDEFSFWIKYVETPEKFQISHMRHTYTLNTTLDNYLDFMADIDLQKKLDQSIDAFERVVSNEDVNVLYLRYKKIMFMDPRDFLYVKKTERNGDEAVEISKSIQVVDFQPKSASGKSTTRALLMMSGNIVRQVEENKLEITSYAECNMKMKLKPVMTKIASKNEIKKIVKKYRDHFNQN